MILLCRDHVASTLTDEEICHTFQSVRVLCISDLRNLSSHSGQTALVTLVSLLSRMGMQVELSIPEVALLSRQPPFIGHSLPGALISSSEAIISGAAVQARSGMNTDIVFLLGDTRLQGRHKLMWRLGGGEWFGALTKGAEPHTAIWTAKWPVGAMVSAALAANEAFKFVIRRLPLRNSADDIYFEASSTCGFDFGSIPLPSSDIELEEVDVISAGAISQAVLYALIRVPPLHMRGRIFDDDANDPSNLNRNMLSLISDVKVKKVIVAARRCGSKLQLEPVSQRFTDRVGMQIKLAPRLLIGVDDIPSRWEVQRWHPEWLAVGATSHFSVSSSAHRRGEPCCGCLHPRDDAAGPNPIPTVAFVSFWAGLATAVRLVRDVLGFPYPNDRQQLWLTPLRMDKTHASMWSPVAPRKDCPVPCLVSQAA
jgi:hypothetical protein